MSNEGNIYIMFTYLLTCVQNLNIILQIVFGLGRAQTICPDNGSYLINTRSIVDINFIVFYIFVAYKNMCASHVQNSQLFPIIVSKTSLYM